jgi:hypothetical protein
MNICNISVCQLHENEVRCRPDGLLAKAIKYNGAEIPWASQTGLVCSYQDCTLARAWNESRMAVQRSPSSTRRLVWRIAVSETWTRSLYFFLIQYNFVLGFYFSRRTIFTANIDPQILLKYTLYIAMWNTFTLIFVSFRTKQMSVLSYRQNIFASINTHNNTALTLSSKDVSVCATHYLCHVTHLLYSVFGIILPLKKNWILIGLALFCNLVDMQCSVFSSTEYLYMV